MRYKISLIETYKSRPYAPENEETVETSEITEKTTQNVDVAKRILKEFIDPADYEMSDENIRREFGETIPEKAFDQIRNYYGIRKLIYGDALSDLENARNDWNRIRNPLVFRYEVPEACNHYCLVEDDRLDDGWEQGEFTVVLKVFE